MRSFLVLIIFNLGTIICIAQNSNPKPVEFKVQGKEKGYDILPSDNFLFLGNPNKIKVIQKEKGKSYSVKVTNGSVRKGSKDHEYIIESLEPTNCLVSIYEQTKDNKSKLVYNKPYQVIPFPVIKIAGVKCDSMISQLQLAAGNFYAEYKGSKYKLKVTGFKLEMFEDNKFSTDSSSSGRLTKKMLGYISKLKPGAMLYFKDFTIMANDGMSKTIPIYRVFITDEFKPDKLGL